MTRKDKSVYAMEDFMPYVNRMLVERSRATAASRPSERKRNPSS